MKTILDRSYSNYISLYKPLDKTPRCNLLKVFSAVDAGIYHQLLGGLDYPALQIFPDTAAGDSLRGHWASRVPPLHASSAAGKVIAAGAPNLTLPAGLVFVSNTSERYFTEKQCRINSDGIALADVRSENFGAKTNLQAGAALKIVSAIPAGADSEAEAAEGGVSGGEGGETDEEYLALVPAALRNPSRCGKSGGFAAWAADSSLEVSKAWEFKNFGVFGSLLIQVVNGGQFDGVHPAGSLRDATDYINRRAPPSAFTARTPQIITLNPPAALQPHEGGRPNRYLAANRMRGYLQTAAKPGFITAAGMLRDSIIDGITISDAAVKLNGSPNGTIPAAVLQYPYLGGGYWGRQFADPHSGVSLFCRAKLPEFIRFRRRMAALRNESKPQSAEELLDDWGRALAGSVSAGLDMQRRRAELLQKTNGAVTRDDMQKAAEVFGFAIAGVRLPHRPAFFGFSHFGVDRISCPASRQAASISVNARGGGDRIEQFETFMRARPLANYIPYFFYDGGAS